MNEKRVKLGHVCGDFGLIINDEWIDLHSMSENCEKNVQICINKINELLEENKNITLLAQHNYEESKRIIDRYVDEIKELKKELHLMHMRSMFSTVKSFKGDVSKRYKYSEETDTIYDTANNYGQYHKILDKKEVCMLLNEYETLLNKDDLND